MIYKISPRIAWKNAETAGVFAGAPVDIKDGFIHFSAAHQLRETAARHFAGEQDLVLVVVDTDRLGEALIWEKSRGGDLFPHLYAPLLASAVTEAMDLPLDADGMHRFPDFIP
ncbi:MAG: DUF952 domain-containing protein [Beijerinckiaceae bacterium]